MYLNIWSPVGGALREVDGPFKEAKFCLHFQPPLLRLPEQANVLAIMASSFHHDGL